MSFDPITIGAATAVVGLASSATHVVSETSDAFASVLSSAVQSAEEVQVGPAKTPASPLSSLSGFYESMTGKAPSNANDPIRIEDVREYSSKLVSTFHRRVGDLLDAAGIDFSEELRITQDGSGALRVAGDHPRKAEIEALLAQDSEISQEFSRISSMLSLVKAADEHFGFARAYERDPNAALAQYSHLFGDRKNSTLEILLDQFGVNAELV